jgi:hypothetical protein
MNRRGAFVALLTVLLVLSVAGPASAAYKPFSLTIATSAPTFDTASGVTGSGQTVTITAKFTNENTTQQLGSANVGVPSVLNVTGASVPSPATVTPATCTGAVTGQCLQLRGLALAPGQSITVTINVQTQLCAQGPFTWTVEAKQSNDFSGLPGNDLNLDSAASSVLTTLDGACTLAFITQPHDALTNHSITGTDWSATGSPVTVSVLDGSKNVVTTSTVGITAALGANPGGAGLTGTTPDSISNGTASFGHLTINAAANGYTLTASPSSGTLATATSSSFDVAGTSAPCNSGAACKTNQGNGAGSGQVTAVPTGTGLTGLLLESANANGGKQLNCSGYTSADQNTYSFLTTIDAAKVITITIKSPAVPLSGSPSKILNGQQICLGATSSFTTAKGYPLSQGLLPDGITSGYIGVLPNCTTGATGPCHDRGSDTTVADASSPLGFDLVLVARIPASFSGDPWSR